MTSVSVVIATKDRSERLDRLVDLLLQQTRAPLQIVIVDDGSRDRTPELLASRVAAGQPITVLRREVSGGPSAARNAGAQLARGDVVAFTDDDCQPRRDWLASLVEGFSSGASVVAGQTIADPLAYAARGPWSHWMVTSSLDAMFSTCNIAYSRELFESLGGFDEGFQGTRGGAQWGEDTDLGWRAVEAGATVVYDESSVVQHDVVSRTWRGYCIAALRRQGIARLVKKHPGFREHLWGSVFLNQSHAWAPLGALGLVVGAALLPDAASLAGIAVVVAFAPWVRFRLRVWPIPARRRDLPYVLPLLWLADLVETAVVILAAGKSRVLLV